MKETSPGENSEAVSFVEIFEKPIDLEYALNVIIN